MTCSICHGEHTRTDFDYCRACGYGEETMKVYCKDCKFYEELMHPEGHSFIAGCTNMMLADDTALEPMSKPAVPQIQNKNNDCEGFEKRVYISTWRRLKRWITRS